MLNYKAPDPIIGNDLCRYFLEHARPKGVDFHVVTKDLPAFKRVFSYNPRLHSYLDCGRAAIVNLVIPRGAVIYASADAFDTKYPQYVDRKMRATSAVVHSVVDLESGNEIPTGWSSHDWGFKYRPGAKVKPKLPFGRHPAQCASGIHFFLNVNDALRWTL